MVLSSMVEGLKILQVKGLPTKARLMKQKRSTRTPYQACNHETAISSQHSPSSSPPVSPQRKAKKRGYADHGVWLRDWRLASLRSCQFFLTTSGAFFTSFLYIHSTNAMTKMWCPDWTWSTILSGRHLCSVTPGFQHPNCNSLVSVLIRVPLLTLLPPGLQFMPLRLEARHDESARGLEKTACMG